MPTGHKPRPPDGVVRLSFEGVYSTAKWANILYLNTTTSATPTVLELKTLVDDCANLWIDQIMPLLQSAGIFTFARGIYFAPADTEVVADDDFDTAGGDDSGGTVASVASCISWLISAYYRGGHPRTYLSALPQDAQEDVKTLKLTYANSLATAAGNLLTGINVLAPSPFETVTLGTVSFASGGEWREPPVFRPYEGAVVHTRIDSQRRRLGKELT